MRIKLASNQQNGIRGAYNKLAQGIPLEDVCTRIVHNQFWFESLASFLHFNMRNFNQEIKFLLKVWPTSP